MVAANVIDLRCIRGTDRMPKLNILATRNWSQRPVRALSAAAAIAVGTAAVVWVSATFESLRMSVALWQKEYIGRSQISVEAQMGKYGAISEGIARELDRLEGVASVTPLLVRRVNGLLISAEQAQADAQAGAVMQWRRGLPEIDAHGIDPEREAAVRDWKIVAGEALAPDEARRVCLVEVQLAEEAGLGLGDTVRIWGGGSPDAVDLQIVGLVDRKRVARFQKGLVLMPLRLLQGIENKRGRITSVDVVTESTDRDEINAVAKSVRDHLRRRPFGRSILVTTTLARMKQVEQARLQQEAVLALLSSVAMLTALFIIVSTLSVGMIERVAQLGLLRCIGLTGGQLARLVLIEIVPLGVLGMLVGVPLGLGLAGLTVFLAPDYIGSFHVSYSGIAIACAAGIVTTFAASILPMIAALRVSPLAAARPRATRPNAGWIIGVALGAAALLIGQFVVLHQFAIRSPTFVQPALASLVMLYLAYAGLVPLVIWLISRPIVAVAARVLRLQRRLLADQIGHAVWRSTGIVCGLMVGLSLIVGLLNFANSFRSGWQFPKQFPAGYLWSHFGQLREYHDDVDELVGGVEGIESFTTATATNVHVQEKPRVSGWDYLLSITWFFGGDPNTFFDLVRVEFLEGNREDAIAKLKQGGHIVVAEDFARSRAVGKDDKVKIFFGSKAVEFVVAAVVTSPALDIAAGYFQVNSEFRIAASGSVIGSVNDVVKHTGVRGRNVVLYNFASPPEMPEDWPPPRGSELAASLSDREYEEAFPAERRWRRYNERLTRQRLGQALGDPNVFTGTVADLKDEIDLQLTRATTLMTVIPLVALLVAGLGVANLMSASVTSRAKQIAMLRAIGATKGLITRLVLGEALVLGLLGSALGIALGVHLASNTTTLTAEMWGLAFDLVLDWGMIWAAIALTVALCILAGVLPARNASRTNITDALRVS